PWSELHEPEVSRGRRAEGRLDADDVERHRQLQCDPDPLPAPAPRPLRRLQGASSRNRELHLLDREPDRQLGRRVVLTVCFDRPPPGVCLAAVRSSPSAASSASTSATVESFSPRSEARGSPSAFGSNASSRSGSSGSRSVAASANSTSLLAISR